MKYKSEIIVACLFLAGSIWAYYFVFRFTGFPTSEVATAISISFVSWAISAAIDPVKYRNWGGFLFTMIAFTTLLTGGMVVFTRIEEIGRHARNF